MDNIKEQRFGRLVAKEWKGNDNPNRVSYWECECDCGNTKTTSISRLRNGQCTSCGCANIENLIDRRFGKLTVKKYMGKDPKNKVIWLCICDCTKVFIRNAADIKRSSSCGCSKEAISLVGQKFGKFLVLSQGKNNSCNKVTWICQCECKGKPVIKTLKELKESVQNNYCKCKNIEDLTGQIFGNLLAVSSEDLHVWQCLCECNGENSIVPVSATLLKNGSVKSCGCGLGRIDHGYRYHNLYSRWCKIKERCYNPNYKSFHTYGGKGVSVWKGWKTSPKAFIEYCMDLPGYNPKLQIDRINNDGNYEPGNCRWETPVNNCNNKSNNLWVYDFGEKLTFSQAVRIYGKVSIATAGSRLRRGWSVLDAITTPLGHEQ